MKIATWNVNSIKARLDHAIKWLGDEKPDILMMQELKGLEFPADAFTSAGYQVNFVPQKTYNGVAIISRQPPAVILDRLPGDDSDEQARYLEVEYQGLRLIDIYAPNGNPVDTDKFTYKLSWLNRLYHRISQLRQQQIDFIIGGDFNIIPEERDCHDPRVWANDALFRIESRQAWRAILNLGLTDAFRMQNKNAGHYTFWDYQAGAWPQNKGIRIDHFLLSPVIADRFIGCTIDKTPRGWEKASDHTPVMLEIAA